MTSGSVVESAADNIDRVVDFAAPIISIFFPLAQYAVPVADTLTKLIDEISSHPAAQGAPQSVQDKLAASKAQLAAAMQAAIDLATQAGVVTLPGQDTPEAPAVIPQDPPPAAPPAAPPQPNSGTATNAKGIQPIPGVSRPS